MAKHGSHSASFGVSFLKGTSGGGGGGGGDENKNKFEKLTDPSQKRGSLFPSADKRICLGCLQWQCGGGGGGGGEWKQK